MPSLADIIGYFKNKFTDSERERRHQLGLILKREAEEKRILILHQYKMQSDWLQWGLDTMMDNDLTWNKLLYGYGSINQICCK